ncbi:MAG: response regulator [Sulfurimonas sp.]|nr:response regulator [Sulfurimonas sp.]MCK4974073.1 response regulator [Sulfurimonas sp.]
MTTKEILKMTNNLHLLYVEDDLGMRETSVGLFKNFFTQIATAVDGVEGLEKYENGSFDIIVTDISMPRMDGIELIKRIRAKDKDIPIIVYSAWNEPSYMAECISMNVDGYLLKPMQIKNIMEVLEKISVRLLYSPRIGQ